MMMEYLDILQAMPEDTYFDLYEGLLELQAATQAKVQQIRDVFRKDGLVWKRPWRKDCDWWQYTATWGDMHVKMYAVKENPARCTAIRETRVIKERVPIRWEEQEVEREVLVGWDCSGAGEGDEPAA